MAWRVGAQRLWVYPCNLDTEAGHARYWYSTPRCRRGVPKL